jgi:hypothetical protein
MRKLESTENILLDASSWWGALNQLELIAPMPLSNFGNRCKAPISKITL